MSAHWFQGFVPGGLNQRSFVHSASLAAVWLTMATSGVVFSEPCPTDVLAMGLIILLPAVGLVRFGAPLAALTMAWIVIACCGLVASLNAYDLKPAVVHTLVSLFLSGASVTIAAFIAAKPEAHLRLIFNGLTVGAAIAAVAGLIGYFELVPGAEMFTKFGRAAGTFKDPNVFGPFLVPPLLYMVHVALSRPIGRAWAPMALAGVLGLAVFLSFSRGAWVNLTLALATYVVLAFATASTAARQQKITLLSAFGAGIVALMVMAASQVDKVGELLSERASVTQDYDVGPEGRFGGQQKAMALILEHPFGIGAGQFSEFHHHEEPHNVYLSMFLNAGWIGGAGFAIISVMTVLIGLRSCLIPTAAQPYQLIAVAALIANVGEGAIIDTDHWRHFYLLVAMVWGIAAATGARAAFGFAGVRPARA